MCYQSSDIFKKLSEYCQIHKRCSPDIAYLNLEYNLCENAEETNESDCTNDNNVDVDVDPPKFLADLFESVAGAIYLDSNCSLNSVWKAYYPMLEPYLGKIRRNFLT